MLIGVGKFLNPRDHVVFWVVSLVGGFVHCGWWPCFCLSFTRRFDKLEEFGGSSPLQVWFSSLVSNTYLALACWHYVSMLARERENDLVHFISYPWIQILECSSWTKFWFDTWVYIIIII